MGFKFNGIVFLTILAFGEISAQIPDDECPFFPGSCPATIDNVVDVFYHDVTDQVSCQRQCKTIPDCKFFTMFGVDDEPTDHMKCFLFKTCDHLEPCPDCISGPEEPPFDKTNCTYDGNYTCNTDIHNIVDVYYFDVADDFSCHHQCTLLSDCNYWTHFDVTDNPRPHHKCFLYKDCTIQEPCTSCETGPKDSPYHESLYQEHLRSLENPLRP